MIKRSEGSHLGGAVTHHGVIHHLRLDFLEDALLLSEDLEGHRQHVHERDARHEPEDLPALGTEDVEELEGAVDHAVDSAVLVILDELGNLRYDFTGAVQ